MEDKIFCNYNGEKNKVYLYQKYDTFIYRIKKTIGIENEINDLKFYIKYNDSLSIDITDQNTYQEYILNDPNINEIYCESVNTNKNIKGDKKELLDIINNLKDQIVTLNGEKLEILKRNEELENEKKKIQKKFDDYQKEANEVLEKLQNEINNLTIRINNENNVNLHKKNTPSGNELDNQNLIPKNENREFIVTKKGENEVKETTRINSEDPNSIESKETNCESTSLLSKKIYSLECNLISHELKSNSKNQQYIKAILQIKNNGSLILPKNCYIKNIPYENESDLLIKETIVNHDSINFNQFVEIPIHLYNKNKIINKGNHTFSFVLYNNKMGIIGKEIEMNIHIF